ncbi:NAD(FAD)-utilizing dehydrogenase [Sulfuricella sp. T08]|uniref:TIGR03862 family flavoprotein n=1 Tax=Sulfuricella sp. T08 TaxID=1632857 RepID=UPI0006179D71|nr:TIGR03862 family flavoprotein [Sulfuricella sp. T08]GAO36892.1 NAD(FAD)-utilizing dehydrogenase [Sulfuricella sp. T08]
MSSNSVHARTVAVIGGGPAGLMAAEILSQNGVHVDLYDAMPSVGRKFLLAGKGGLNLTHSETSELFLSRYGARRAQIEPWLAAFGPEALRLWAHGLGVETYVGTSGRVFPTEMKAAPLLRAWLHRLRVAGVRFHMRHRWHGWSEDGALRFSTPEGGKSVHSDAVVLALGGGSWARLGSNGAWVPLLEQRGISVAALRPSNCGFDVGWSEHFQTRFAGHPLKSVVATFTDKEGVTIRKQGEFMVTATGVEGSLIYALSAPLRDEIESAGAAVIYLDLLPDRELSYVIAELARPRGSRSMASHLQSRLGIKGVKAGLLRECVPAQDFSDPARLGAAIKALTVRLIAPRPLDEAISSAGGVTFEELDERLMIRSLPGVFCAGEMLDWEAPTGGYLLTACLASGRAAGLGVLAWKAENN